MANNKQFIILVLSVLFSYPVYAEETNKVEYNGYTIHFNAYPSDHLQPNMAKAIGVKRDQSHAVVTVVVNKNKADKSPESVKASVKGNAFNLTGMMRRMKLRELKDKGAIYYISDFDVRKGEHLTFALSVKPDGESQEKEFKFSKQF
jgi:hypothetical protein